MKEQIVLFKSEDGVSWEKVSKDFNDVLEDLIQGKKVRCIKWREGVYLDVWKGYVRMNNEKNCWHWTPKAADFQEAWETVE